MPFENEIIIKNVKYFNPNGTVDEGNIFISNDKITRITPPSSTAEIKSTNVIDGRGKFATPGFVNSHTHASMTLLRSYSDDKGLMDWLNKDIWPIEGKMKRRDIYWGAALAAVEMIKGGTTAFMDMYGPNMEEVAKVTDESGLRGALCRNFSKILTARLTVESKLCLGHMQFTLARLIFCAKFVKRLNLSARKFICI